MDWGTLQDVASQEGADAALADLKLGFPEVDSVYVPSGKVPTGGLVALVIGAGLGVPIGAMAAILVGAITVTLLVLMGLFIAVVAACGWVVCITVVIEIGIAVIGGGLTFATAGFVPGWLTAHAGLYGKNRSPAVAALVALPSTIGAYAILVATPQVLALMVDPPSVADDMSFAALVHLLDGSSWIHITIWVVGFVIALAISWLSATGEVGAQKFCESCDRHMDDLPLHGMSFEFAEWAFAQIRGGDATSVAQHLTETNGVDVEPTLFACPSCHLGFFEARAHFFAQWQGSEDPEDMRRDWLCFSWGLASDQTPQLALARRPDEAY